MILIWRDGATRIAWPWLTVGVVLGVGSELGQMYPNVGLKTTVRVIEIVYEAGRKAAEFFKAAMPVKFDDILPKWNYQVVPQSSTTKIPV